MAASDPHFRLRVPEDIRDRIEQSASANGRSINAEIVFRLKESLDRVVTEKDRMARALADLEHRRTAVLAQYREADVRLREIESRLESLRGEVSLNRSEE